MNDIGIITTKLMKGGAELQIAQLAQEFHNLGYSVSVLSFLKPEAHDKKLIDLGVNVKCLDIELNNKLTYIKGLYNIIEWIKESKFKRLIFFNYHPILLGRLLYKLGIYRHVYTSIRCENFHSKIRNALIKMTSRWCNYNIVNSLLVGAKLCKYNILIRNNVKCIKNGIDLDIFDRKYKPNKSILIKNDSKKFILIAVGRLDAEKDHIRIIEAFNNSEYIRENCMLYIAGEGNERSNLESAIKQYQLSLNCILLGERNDIPSLLQFSDAFILSSSHESFPNSLMEALASGLPVISTVVGGVEEILINEKNSILINKMDTESLIQGIVKMLRLSNAKRSKFGLQGKKVITDQYDKKKVALEWLYLLNLRVDRN